DRGVLAPAIRPPTVPVGMSRLRVAPTAAHTHEQLNRCLDAFEAAGEEVGLR
ncbi:8-amino-7-oxononanoate synthase, partial [Halorubrum pallidum]